MATDGASEFNKERWEALVNAHALFSRPWLQETKESALQRVDPLGLLGDLQGKKALCLAGGGGQQAVAFSLNGARVCVLDLAEGQLQRDREAALHYGYSVSTIQGDMRDLSALPPESFDIVSQPYSLNFVPDCREVFPEVARVLRRGGFTPFGRPTPLRRDGALTPGMVALTRWRHSMNKAKNCAMKMKLGYFLPIPSLRNRLAHRSIGSFSVLY